LYLCESFIGNIMKGLAVILELPNLLQVDQKSSLSRAQVWSLYPTSNKQHFRLFLGSLDSVSIPLTRAMYRASYLHCLFAVVIFFNGVDRLFHVAQHEVAMTVVGLGSVSTMRANG